MPTRRRRAAPRGPSGPGSGKKLKHNLTALSSAAVLAVYGAGYLRTRAAAERFVEHVPARPLTPSAPSAAPPTQTADRPPASASISSATTGASPSSSRSTPSSRPEAASTSLTPPATPGVPEPIAAAGEPRPVAVVEEPAAPVPVSEPAAVPAPASAAAADHLTTETVAGAAATAPVAAPPPAYKDGTFTGWGTSRHGDIEATVTIAGGRIISAVISQCWTRWSCSWIAALPPQVPARQSAEVDYVSGATQSTNAFYYAVVQALSKAQ